MNTTNTMNDQNMMDNLLTTTKGICDLMMHGAIESASPDVHNAFTQTLNVALSLQNQIYNEMSKKGWNPTPQAEERQICQAREKFEGNA